MPKSPEPNNYQLGVVLLGISPIIWRRRFWRIVALAQVGLDVDQVTAAVVTANKETQ